MTSRSPKSNSQGFTLIETIAVLALAGIIMGFAIPSLLTLNKPLRDGSLQFKSQLNLIRSKAIASNQAYRLRPKFQTRAEYDGGIPRNFVVEYAANCSTKENLAPPAALRWQRSIDIDLPVNIGITDVSSTTLPNPSGAGNITVSNALNWNICFDNRGIANSTAQLIIKDFRGDNQANIALFDISQIGGADIYTYTKDSPISPSSIPLNTQGNPVF